MSFSQFTLYSSNDAGSPTLTGQTGSLLSVLNACLVNGYGAKTAAGWSKPFNDVTASGAGTNVVGGFRQGSGSRLYLFVNDGGTNSTSVGKEASLTGWESLTNYSGSVVGTLPNNLTASVGGGTGQFPTPSQGLTTGRVVARKSVTADSTARIWFVAADASTFHLWISTGDTAGTYYGVSFGDIFSMKGSSDSYRVLIMGRNIDNSAAAGASDVDYCDAQWITAGSSLITHAQPGHFMPRTFGGGGTSITAGKIGDTAKNTPLAGNVATPFVGIVQTPNGPDNSYYLSPIFVYESSTGTIRGRWRGVYNVCHPLTSFSDGQTFAGANDYAGKNFLIIKQGPGNGFWALETSATVDTN
jgi:hypothetical protein